MENAGYLSSRSSLALHEHVFHLDACTDQGETLESLLMVQVETAVAASLVGLHHNVIAHLANVALRER